MKKEVCIISTLFIIFLISCDNNKLPKAQYFESYSERYIPVIIEYKNNALQVNNSSINAFDEFRYSYVGVLPGFEENTRHCLISLDIDKATTFEEIDSIFKEIGSGRFRVVFLLVNSVKDTVGFTLGLPFYNELFSLPFMENDTIRIDNLIRLFNDSIIINGRSMRDSEVDRKIKEIVYKRENMYMQVEKSTNYQTFIGVLEKYHEHRQYSKELYSELNFNKKYIWLCQLPRYYYEIKNEVDEKYASRLYLIDSNKSFGKTIVTVSD